ncbi:ABC transporter [Chloropicon primus]|uniref:ABC transporter n=1 Tax=Chloropicon primus TaxID=1764295 RepID=A0A5B8MXT3_9CHLO|nr:ABC transporter [Chloropicon primus]UPR03508.1 ABC transporter [Chloropicon primus]|eukprot:QDZ24300.1 ABC transporter [Chloropicon primus]
MERAGRVTGRTRGGRSFGWRTGERVAGLGRLHHRRGWRGGVVGGRRPRRGVAPSWASASRGVNGVVVEDSPSPSTAGERLGVPKGEEDASPRASGKEVLRETLRESVRSNLWGLAAVGVVLLVVTSVILAQPLLSGAFFQNLVVPNPDAGAIKKVLIAMLVAYAAEPACTFLYVTTVSKVAQKFVSDLQKKVFAMILAQNTAFFDLNETTSLLAIVSSEINTVSDVIGQNLSRDRGFRAILEAAGGVIVLGLIAPQLAPVLLAFIFLTSVNAALYSRKTKGLFAQREMFKLKMNSTATTAFSNIKTVRAFAAERHEFTSFLGMLRKADHIGLSLGQSKARLESLARFAIYSSLLLLYTYGGSLVIKGAMPVRSLIAGIGYTFSLVFATQGITNTFADMSRAMVSVKKIEDFVDTLEPISTSSEDEIMDVLALRSESCDEESSEVLPVVENRESNVISLHVDSFSYPTRPNTVALKNVNLELKSGKVTALVGPSGAGKSSIVQLLSRFYKLENGSMKFNGIDAAKFSRKEWSKAVSLVGQQPVLFPGTIQTNIAYALEDVTPSQVRDAAVAANANEFIMSLPDGYDTDVGEAGGRLSGGQRQRIAIARAFIRDSPVLLLDEATSALDAQSEKLVQEALEKLYSEKAVLVIAHRLSTVVSADEIIVVEEGEVRDRGTHQELLRRDSLYQKLIGAQQINMAL